MAFVRDARLTGGELPRRAYLSPSSEMCGNFHQTGTLKTCRAVPVAGSGLCALAGTGGRAGVADLVVKRCLQAVVSLCELPRCPSGEARALNVPVAEPGAWPVLSRAGATVCGE